MLRLQLLECLRTLAIQVDQQQRESEEADFWANRLITAVRHSSPRFLKMMEQLVERYPEPTPHFASELVAHLYDDEGALPVVSGWLNVRCVRRCSRSCSRNIGTRRSSKPAHECNQ